MKAPPRFLSFLLFMTCPVVESNHAATKASRLQRPWRTSARTRRETQKRPPFRAAFLGNQRDLLVVTGSAAPPDFRSRATGNKGSGRLWARSCDPESLRTRSRRPNGLYAISIAMIGTS